MYDAGQYTSTGSVGNGWLVCVRMNTGIISVFVESLDMSYIEPAPFPLCGLLDPKALLMPFLLMCDSRKLNLSCVQSCLSVSSFEATLDLDCKSLPWCVLWHSNHVLQTWTEFASPGKTCTGFMLPMLIGLTIEFLVVLHKIDYRLLIRINQENVGHLSLLPLRLTG